MDRMKQWARRLLPQRSEEPDAHEFDRLDRPADICLLLEGTYPYVTGGVSTWVHQIISSMPQLSFALFYIGPRRELDPVIRYELPANVVSLRRIYLFDDELPKKPTSTSGPSRRRLYAELEALHAGIKQGGYRQPLLTMMDAMAPPTDRTERSGPESRCPMAHVNARNFLQDREAWDLLTDLYERYSQEPSFIDYFWSIRFMHLPIWKLMGNVERVQQAFAYHTVSTGFAGLLGSLVHARRRRPLLLTEHGIYTKERKIELAQAEWIHATRQAGYVPFQEPGYLKELWMSCFEFMGRATYQSASKIVTLFDGNRLLQIQQGAPAEKVTIIPNGIDVNRFAAIAAGQSRQDHPTVGFIGRIVPIKDVKTLIRATRIAAASLPDLEVLLVGPTDEAPAYVRECRDLVSGLDLEHRIRFLGKREITEVLGRIDLLVLTSISEALPLVILEAQAAGVPVVTTDVGACRELVEGRLPEDRDLGPSGLVTYIADPEGTARAMLRVLLSDTEHASMSRAGLARATRFYRQSMVIDKYRHIYQDYIEMGRQCDAGTLASAADQQSFAEAAEAAAAEDSTRLIGAAIREEERRVKAKLVAPSGGPRGSAGRMEDPD